MKLLNLKNNLRDLNAYIQDVRCARSGHNNCYQVVELFSNDTTITYKLLQPLFDYYYNRQENK